jgi:inner membrane protein YidH
MNFHPSDHLANERTFLAYVRTAIAFIGLGFVVARFGVFLREYQIAVHVAPHGPGVSAPLGIAMVVAGVGIAAFGLYRYIGVERAIDRGTSPALSARGAATIVVVLVLIGLTLASVLAGV